MGSDTLRACLLRGAEMAGFRKEVIRLDTNNVCNIECIMCRNRPEKCTDERRMGLDEFKLLIDRFAKEVRFLYLSCSYEPLSTPGFIDYLAWCRSKKVPYLSFATNGLLLNDELIEFLVDEQVSEIIISFNGFNRDDYNRIMFRSDYDAILRKLEKLKEHKRKKGTPFPSVRVNTILMRSNIIQFDSLVKFIHSYDIDQVQFRAFKIDAAHNNNPAEIEKERLSTIPPREMHEYSANIQRHLEDLAHSGKRVIVPLDVLKKGDIAEFVESSKSRSCCVPFFSKFIDHQGNIRVCCGEHEEAHIGNFFKDSESDLAQKLIRFRALALSGRCRNNCKMFLNSSTML